jgi:hypothetical protein
MEETVILCAVLPLLLQKVQERFPLGETIPVHVFCLLSNAVHEISMLRCS